MGAVQKLATVVIIGLVALATVLTVYIAREPDRRGEETTEQEDIAIERGTDLYIQYCLTCHGPAGLGSSGQEEPSRIGPPLNKEGAGIPVDPPETFVNFQSDDAAEMAIAEEFIHYRIQYGAPSDPRLTKIMPAFGTELNVEEINDLVYLVMNGDWDYVYNQAVLSTGESVALAECEEGPEPGNCEEIDDFAPAYPTAPSQESDSADEATPADEANTESSGEAAVELEASDPYEWSQSEITVKPGDTIAVTNVGSLEHNFTVDELGIAEDLPTGGSETVMITIPDDAEPGDYAFYCSVPGHREAGMEGTLTIEGS